MQQRFGPGRHTFAQETRKPPPPAAVVLSSSSVQLDAASERAGHGHLLSSPKQSAFPADSARPAFVTV